MNWRQYQFRTLMILARGQKRLSLTNKLKNRTIHRTVSYYHITNRCKNLFSNRTQIISLWNKKFFVFDGITDSPADCKALHKKILVLNSLSHFQSKELLSLSHSFVPKMRLLDSFFLFLLWNAILLYHCGWVSDFWDFKL